MLRGLERSRHLAVRSELMAFPMRFVLKHLTYGVACMVPLTQTTQVIAAGSAARTMAVASHVAPNLRSSGTKSPWLYVVGNLPDSVYAYDLGEPGFPQTLAITQGLSAPLGIALDDRGTVYVANSGNGTVTEYAAGQTSPSLTLTELATPVGVAVDRKGSVFVSNRAALPGVAVYGRGQTVPSRYIIGNLVTSPAQLAFDATGNLYLADNVGGVSVLKRGSSAFASLQLQGLSSPSGVAVDPRDGNVFVSDVQTQMLQVYSPGTTTPASSVPLYFSPNFLGASQPQFDWLFVPLSSWGIGGTVYVYNRETNKRIKTLKTGANTAEGVVYKPPGVAP
jgi:streptogramin lyase